MGDKGQRSKLEHYPPSVPDLPVPPPAAPPIIRVEVTTAPVTEVWVVEVWKAHGYDHYVLGVYANREAAFEALKAEPNMTVWVDGDGGLRGRPAGKAPERWARGYPMRVQERG